MLKCLCFMFQTNIFHNLLDSIVNNLEVEHFLIILKANVLKY